LTSHADRNPPSVLYVDDDARALDLFREQVKPHFRAATASNGAAGLDLLRNEGPFAAVISDYQMLGMNGLTFLSKAREIAPDTTRLLLTGRPDLTAAVGAVNAGYCFRFITKPCPRVILVRTLEAAAEQYQLVTSRRVLLEQTLQGSIKTLSDILGWVNPTAFGRAARARDHMDGLLDHFGITDRWEAEMAATLSHIGSVALPAETALKLYRGESLGQDEQRMADRLPQLAEDLLAGIPQLEGVRAILRYQNKHYDGQGTPPDRVQGRQIPWGARALKVVLDYDLLEAQGLDPQVALDTMRSRKLVYDPEILDGFAQIRGAEEHAETIQEVSLRELISGMVFAEDVRAQSGQMLVARGTEVTAALSERLRNLAPNAAHERVRVLAIRPSHTQLAS
jgi:response regulator RpfG family c-di-GMP phosphodiesterase